MRQIASLFKQRFYSIPSEPELKQLVLVFLVGGLNTLFGYSVYALLIFLQLHYVLASLLATISGILFNFKTTGVIVFKNHNNSLIYRFIAVYVCSYIINVVSLKMLSEMNINLYLAGALLVIPIALITYVLQKKFVFGGE